MKDHSVWKDRQEQSVFGKDISTLVGIKFGSIFISEEQGGGEVSILVFKGRGVSSNKMKEVKKYIKNSFELEEKDISLGHGHHKGTIVVNLSEISLASKKIIQEEIHNKIILPDRIKKTKDRHLKIPTQKTLPIPIPSNKIEELEVVTEEIQVEQTQIETKNPVKMEKEKFSIIKKGRFFFTSFLAAMFKFEGIILSGKDNIFYFDGNKTEDYQTINFRNEVEASMANEALTWIYGDSKVLPAMEKNYIMLDFLYFNFSKRYSKNVVFTHSPIQGESVERIQKRAIRLMNGYKPSRVYVINKESFSLGFPTLSSTEKFFNFAKGMGWDAFMQDDLIICKFRPKPEIALDELSEVSTISEFEEVVVNESIPEVKEVAPVPEPEKKVLSSSFVSPRDMDLPPLSEGTIGFIEVKPLSIKDLFSQAEAIQKFNEIYNSDTRWSNVPSDKRMRIVKILRKDLEESNPEVFAGYLLNLNVMDRPLFSKEEAISTFRLMMASPDFNQFSVATQNGIISAMKDNLSDDELLDGLLDLF